MRSELSWRAILQISSAGSAGRQPNVTLLKAGVRRVVPGDDLYQGGLAGAIVTQEPHDLVAPHLKVDAAQRRHLAKGLGDIAQLQERTHQLTS